MEKLSEYQSLNHDQKSLSKRHINVYIWCQNSICFSIGVKTQLVFKGVIDWGGARFHKKLSRIIKMFHFERWSEYGYVSLNEFFMSFSSKSKSFKTHIFWHITIPPLWIEGERENCSKYQKSLNQTTFLFPKCFSTYLNQLRSKISKGLIF